MRRPAALGFYPDDKIILEATVKRFLSAEKKFKNPLGIIVPHAGYEFSGSVAGETIASAETEKRDFVIFGPNHSSHGSPVALCDDEWETPLGIVKSNKRLVEKLHASSPVVHIDRSSHLREHSIEVQLPFLQALYNNFSFTPICLQNIELEEIEELAGLFDSNSFYIASSDFIHLGPNYGYEPVEGNINDQLRWVKEQDDKMIDLICKLEPEKFYEIVMENEYTVCGVVPITLLIYIMKNFGAKHGKLIRYKTSYEVYPSHSFVSYAGIVFE